MRNLSSSLKSIITQCLKKKEIYYHSIEARAKTIKSFGEKVAKPSKDDIYRPKYEEPLRNITDLAGVRVITFFTKTIQEVDAIIQNEFVVIERSDKSELLEDKLGYLSIHYLVNLKNNRNDLLEYSRFNGLVAEIQVRTILQHAWAEIEHDIQYKSEVAITKSIKRRFTDLAGLLEIADREFQSIQDEDEKSRNESRINVQAGRLSEVEITPDALKQYLNNKFGIDGRINDFSYWIMADQLISIGFSNFKQIEDCIREYDEDNISRIIWGQRQGQISRFEDVLLAGMGENFKLLHPYTNKPDWHRFWDRRLNELKKADIQVGNYNPNKDVEK
ncbi:MAG: ywaC [Paenibacillaceae bacterium]|jgi:ppGpp synthetase/RelA/SpoT-type nucleotidyltranferase|nr:ywaC [Paenibacillaceae bacterium]